MKMGKKELIFHIIFFSGSMIALMIYYDWKIILIPLVFLALVGGFAKV